MTFIVPPSLDRSHPQSFGHTNSGLSRNPSRVYLWLLGLSCFFPYPALTLGNRTGLQLSHFLSLVILPSLLFGPPTRAIYAFIILAGPRVFSAFHGVMRPGAPDIDIIPKELISSLLAICPLPASTQFYRGVGFRTMLLAGSVAVIVHSILGFYQVYAFSHDQYPFLFLYRNPSFKEMETWAEVYALYVKRPCGLFPEPSALASAVGPWLVLIAGVLLDPVARARYCPKIGPLWVYGLAALLGFVLIALSRSGLTPLILIAVIIAAVSQSRAIYRSLGPGAFVAGLGFLAVTFGALVYVLAVVGDNLDARIDSSWGIRTMSIVTGLTANTEPLDLVFGVGPGQSTAIVRKILGGVPLSKGQDDMAIWSLSVTYYMESGALAALAMLMVLMMILHSIARSAAWVLGLVSLAVWTFAVTLTTSYPHLSSIWLFLGALLEWDAIFPRRPVGKDLT